MPAKKNRAIYQLKVTLRGIRPPVWRRIELSSDVTLAKLHNILQIVMNWQDCHLHEFCIGGQTYGTPQPDDELYGSSGMDERRIRLRDVVRGVGASFQYVYDFGDDWRHDLLLEAVLEPDPMAFYPRCTAGKRSAPPEDVGGPFGYQHYLDAMSNPDHEQHDEMSEWSGPFDPESFSFSLVNEQLRATFDAHRRSAVLQSKPDQTQ